LYRFDIRVMCVMLESVDITRYISVITQTHYLHRQHAHVLLLTHFDRYLPAFALPWTGTPLETSIAQISLVVFTHRFSN